MYETVTGILVLDCHWHSCVRLSLAPSNELWISRFGSMWVHAEVKSQPVELLGLLGREARLFSAAVLEHVLGILLNSDPDAPPLAVGLAGGGCAGRLRVALAEDSPLRFGLQ